MSVDLKLKDAYQYTQLYYYVKAVRALATKGGEDYNKPYNDAKEEYRLHPELGDFETLRIAGKTSAYNEIIFNSKKFPGLAHLSRQDLSKLAAYAKQLGEDHFPTPEEVDKAKEKYDSDMALRLEKDKENVENLRPGYQDSKSALNKARGKVAGSWLLAIVATAGFSVLVGGFAQAISHVITLALGSPVGLASGFALGGIAIGIFGAKKIFEGIVKAYKGIKNMIQNSRKERKDAKEQYKKHKQAYDKARDVVKATERLVSKDNAFEQTESTRYPGQNLYSGIINARTNEEDLVNVIKTDKENENLARIKQEEDERLAREQEEAEKARLAKEKEEEEKARLAKEKAKKEAEDAKKGPRKDAYIELYLALKGADSKNEDKAKQSKEKISELKEKLGLRKDPTAESVEKWLTRNKINVSDIYNEDFDEILKAVEEVKDKKKKEEEKKRQQAEEEAARKGEGSLEGIKKIINNLDSHKHSDPEPTV